MHPYLVRLGVSDEVQAYFAPFYYSNHIGDLCFSYGDDVEHYGFGFHRVPAVTGFWMAGNLNFSQVNQMIICATALEAVAWLHFYSHRFPDRDSLLFLSAGVSLTIAHINWLREKLPGRQFVFAFGKDLLGRLTAIKLAAGIRGQRLSIVFLAEEKVQIRFRGRDFLFCSENCGMQALEKAAAFRFRVRLSTPKNYNTFFDQLKAAAGLTF